MTKGFVCLSVCLTRSNLWFFCVCNKQKPSQKARLSRPHLELGQLPRSANNLRNTKPRGLPGQRCIPMSFSNFLLQEFADHSLFTVMEPRRGSQSLRLIQTFLTGDYSPGIEKMQTEHELWRNLDWKCLIYTGDGFLSPTMNKGRLELKKKAEWNSCKGTVT